LVALAEVILIGEEEELRQNNLRPAADHWGRYRRTDRYIRIGNYGKEEFQNIIPRKRLEQGGPMLTRRELIRVGGFGLLSALALEETDSLAAQSTAKSVPATESPLYLPSSGGAASGVRFANSPNWVRNTPAWYIPNVLSAGSCMLKFLPKRDYQLSSLVKSFRDLPGLVSQAKSLGTEAIYLVDWYEPGWANKGDYIPRSDLGGEAALKDGISAVHAGGGRIIFYVEGWIVSKASDVGKKHGAEWSVILPGGNPPNQYPDSWKMCPAAEGWVSYLESVARRIGQYGADGIFMDSQGWRVDWKCVAKSHKHPLGDPEVFNGGCVNLARRVRTALHSANPEAIIITEGPTLGRQFEFKDGSLVGGTYSLVTGWLWDAQGNTDSITTSFSLDDWNQTLAIGAKLGCPGQFFDAPPNHSATEFLGETIKGLLDDVRDLSGLALKAFWGLNQWRNSGLILGLRMPGLDDLVPKPRDGMRDPVADLYSDTNTLRSTLEGLRPRVTAMDAAFAGQQPSAPAAYIKTLLTARRELARIIDFGSSVARVNAHSPRAVGWRFTGARGTALTAVSVDETPQNLNFVNAAGTWKDFVTGQTFSAGGGTLTVPIPPHRVRLMLQQNER
jgi:hypothetical protein